VHLADRDMRAPAKVVERTKAPAVQIHRGVSPFELKIPSVVGTAAGHVGEPQLAAPLAGGTAAVTPSSRSAELGALPAIGAAAQEAQHPFVEIGALPAMRGLEASQASPVFPDPDTGDNTKQGDKLKQASQPQHLAKAKQRVKAAQSSDGKNTLSQEQRIELAEAMSETGRHSPM